MNLKRFTAAALLTAAISLIAGCSAMNQETRTCTVTGKDRTSGHQNSGSDMRVYTSCGTLTVQDNLISGVDSSDLFGKLQEGHTYRIKTGGFRAGWMSQFPTVLAADEVAR